MTDLQNRLRVIMNYAEAAKMHATTQRVPPDSVESDIEAIAAIAHAVEYLAGIVQKHFKTGEV